MRCARAHAKESVALSQVGDLLAADAFVLFLRKRLVELAIVTNEVARARAATPMAPYFSGDSITFS
jgi:hypothetical protein